MRSMQAQAAHGGRSAAHLAQAKRRGLLGVQTVVVQRHEEEKLAIGEAEEDHLHAGGMRLDPVDQGVQLPGVYLLEVEEFVGRLWLCSGRPPACQQALDM